LNDAVESFIIPFLEERVRADTNFGEREDSVSVGVCDLVKGLTAEDTIDGVHPTLEVHERLGRKLCEFVESQMFGK
jgi:hypothetical protein